jgi:predicted nucleic acid-binding protein
VIYLDTSVALAQLLAEDRRPPAMLWEQHLVSSRLLEYEVWNRVHARKLSAPRRKEARGLIERVDLIELAPAVLTRALEPFPLALRTLDALHLASMHFLGSIGQVVELASYDQRLLEGARVLGIRSIAI